MLVFKVADYGSVMDCLEYILENFGDHVADHEEERKMYSGFDRPVALALGGSLVGTVSYYTQPFYGKDCKFHKRIPKEIRLLMEYQKYESV